jgi:DNA helicase-2/ATP-dependent DNA helicase PcrA
VPDALAEAAATASLSVEDVAAAVEVVGKVMLTTYHSAKGREYTAVILPGLVDGLVPRNVNDRGTWRAPNPVELEEQRRAFYVAVSRAEQQAFLITGSGYETKNGYWWGSGTSPFLVEMLSRLDASSS